MENIWFLRTDKMTHIEDISLKNPFIYSQHGVCAKKEINNLPSVINFKNQIFPKVSISGHKIYDVITEIKEELIQKGIIEYEPKQCNYTIWCWVSVMDIGDIVFVRNGFDSIYVCEISGYVSKEFLDKNGYFGRPVRILKEWKNGVGTEEIKEILHRTVGRKTLEKNAKSIVTKLISEHIEGEVGNKRWK